MLDGVALVGDGTIADRVWARHAISVLGLDAPAVDGAGNIVIPHARAKIAVRVPPGADPVRSMARSSATCARTCPWGAQLEIEVEPASTPIALTGADAAERALEEAYGKPVARMGSGGSVPLVAKLRDAYPDAALVLWGAQDSDLARIHAANESVDLGEIAKIALAEALLLAAARLIPPARWRSPPGGRETNSAPRGVAVWNTGTARPRCCGSCPPQHGSKSQRHRIVDAPNTQRSVRGPRGRPRGSRRRRRRSRSRTSIESPRAKRRTSPSASSVR